MTAVEKPHILKVEVDRSSIAVPDPGVYVANMAAAGQAFAGICRIPPSQRPFELNLFGPGGLVHKDTKTLKMAFVDRIKG